jgi:hypothetical protein
MNPETVQHWLDAYIAAWRTYDPEQIGDLFAEDAAYAFHPWDEPTRGRDGIVEAWLTTPDEPGSWEAAYQPFLVADNRAVATGETRYASGEVFLNIWQLTFDDDGRCCEFVEWYVTPPADKD